MNANDPITPNWTAWDADAPPPPVFVPPQSRPPRAALDLPPQRRIRQRLQRELWISGSFVVVLTIAAVLLGARLLPFFLLPIVLMLTYLAGTLSGLAVLRKAPPADEPVREHLQHVMAHLRRLMRAYIFVSGLAFPFGFVAGMALAWTDYGTIALTDIPSSRMWKGLAICLGLTLLVSWPLYRFYRYVLDKTYGKDLAAWEEALADLADEPLPADPA